MAKPPVGTAAGILGIIYTLFPIVFLPLIICAFIAAAKSGNANHGGI